MVLSKVVFALQLHMEDLRDQSAEHGLDLWLLEAVEQGSEECEEQIPSIVLQSPIQKIGELVLI